MPTQEELARYGYGGQRRPAGQIGGNVSPGGNQGDVGLLDAVSGDEMFTAGVGTYHGELSHQDKGNAEGARQGQVGLAMDLGRRSRGLGGPSVAELQMQRGMNQAQQRLGQQAASARGMSRAGAQGAALRGASDLYSQTNEQAGIMRAQEQIAAQQLYGQQLRDMRQQDLLSRGYGIEEAKAILDADMRAQGINANLANATADRRQGVAMLGLGAIGGALGGLSDRNAKEVMYSDFTGKETLPMGVPGAERAGAGPAMPPPAAAPQPVAPGFQPMLQVAPTTEVDKSAEEQKRSLGESLMAGMAGSGEQGLAQNAKQGFDIGSAIGGALGGLSDMRAKELMPSDFTSKELKKARVGRGAVFDTSTERVDRMGRFEVDAARGRMKEAQRKLDAANLWRSRSNSAREIDEQTRGSYGPLAAMPSDFRGKEPTMGDLDEVAREAMLPFEEMDAQDSREALGPVDPVVYRYKPKHSARMAGEQAELADLRARYAGIGGAAPEEQQAIASGTFEDKRQPRLGIIAQDLQKSPDFRQSVVSTPAGLAVQRDRALSTALGTIAGLDKRLKQLETKRGSINEDSDLMAQLEDMGDEQAAKVRGEPVENERRRRTMRDGTLRRGPVDERTREMIDEGTRGTARPQEENRLPKSLRDLGARDLVYRGPPVDLKRDMSPIPNARGGVSWEDIQLLRQRYGR